MDYRFDVFLSYRRSNLWPVWVEKHFYPLLKHALAAQLGVQPEIFYDRETIETSSVWPLKLAQAHSTSRVLLPLFSTEYFSSVWCVSELSLMQAREKQSGLACPAEPEGLIVPARVHDGESYPFSARRIQAADLTSYSNPVMAEGSPKREALYEALMSWVPDIVSALHRAPPFDAGWRDLAAEQFYKLSKQDPKKQLSVPRLAKAS